MEWDKTSHEDASRSERSFFNSSVGRWSRTRQRNPESGQCRNGAARV